MTRSTAVDTGDACTAMIGTMSWYGLSQETEEEDVVEHGRRGRPGETDQPVPIPDSTGTRSMRDRLEEHLGVLRRRGLIKGWHDRRISAGTEWKDAIDEHLAAADIILLLISSSFINSDYCWDKEMTKALERHAKGEARVIPVVLKPLLTGRSCYSPSDRWCRATPSRLPVGPIRTRLSSRLSRRSIARSTRSSSPAAFTGDTSAFGAGAGGRDFARKSESRLPPKHMSDPPATL